MAASPFFGSVRLPKPVKRLNFYHGIQPSSAIESPCAVLLPQCADPVGLLGPGGANHAERRLLLIFLSEWLKVFSQSCLHRWKPGRERRRVGLTIGLSR